LSTFLFSEVHFGSSFIAFSQAGFGFVTYSDAFFSTFSQAGLGFGLSFDAFFSVFLQAGFGFGAFTIGAVFKKISRKKGDRKRIFCKKRAITSGFLQKKGDKKQIFCKKTGF